MNDEEYEVQRQANIAANLALLQSLGLDRKVKVKKTRPINASPKKDLIPHHRVHRSATRSSASTSTSLSGSDSTFEKFQSTRIITKRDLVRTSDSGEILRTSQRSARSVFYGRQPRTRRQSSFNNFIQADKNDLDDDDGFYRDYVSRNDRGSRDLPMRNAQRLGERIHNPKQFGHIPGIPVGTWWATRMVSL